MLHQVDDNTPVKKFFFTQPRTTNCPQCSRRYLNISPTKAVASVANSPIKINWLHSESAKIRKTTLSVPPSLVIRDKIKAEDSFVTAPESRFVTTNPPLNISSKDHLPLPAAQRTLFSDITVYDEKTKKTVKHQCIIESHGDFSAESLLFPENGIPLFQSALDATEYERAIAQLPAAQLKALRIWTLIGNDQDRYSDGSFNLSVSGQKPINYELNISLRNGFALESDEQFVYDHLTAALKNDSIPTQRGSYLRVAEYMYLHNIPWLTRIKAGDIVTNYPTFMSVSSSDHYAKEALVWDDSDIDHARGLVIYRIDNACRPKPLLANSVSTLRYEAEYLYLPDSYFFVKGISITVHINGQIRIGVTLSEIDPPASGVTAKNIFSGR